MANHQEIVEISFTENEQVEVGFDGGHVGLDVAHLEVVPMPTSLEVNLHQAPTETHQWQAANKFLKQILSVYQTLSSVVTQTLQLWTPEELGVIRNTRFRCRIVSHPTKETFNAVPIEAWFTYQSLGFEINNYVTRLFNYGDWASGKLQRSFQTQVVSFLALQDGSNDRPVGHFYTLAMNNDGADYSRARIMHTVPSSTNELLVSVEFTDLGTYKTVDVDSLLPMPPSFRSNEYKFKLSVVLRHKLDEPVGSIDDIITMRPDRTQGDMARPVDVTMASFGRKRKWTCSVRSSLKFLTWNEFRLPITSMTQVT